MTIMDARYKKGDHFTPQYYDKAVRALKRLMPQVYNHIYHFIIICLCPSTNIYNILYMITIILSYK